MSLINNLWKIVISNLDNDSLRSMCCVDKNFNKLCQPKELWMKNVKREEKEVTIKLLEYAEKYFDNPWKLYHLSKVIPATKEIDGPEKFAMMKKVEKIRKLNEIKVESTLMPYLSGEAYTAWILKKDVNGEFAVIINNSELKDKPKKVHNHGEDDSCDSSDSDSDDEDGQFIIREFCGYFDFSTKNPLKGFLKNNFSSYDGEFHNGYLHGKGEFRYSMGIYRSDCWERSDAKKGLLIWYRGGYYEGEFNRMDICGMGTYVGDTNYKVQGFRQPGGNISGGGVVTDPSGHSFKVTFQDGRIVDPLEIFSERYNHNLQKCVKNNWCTRQYTKKIFFPQDYYYCKTCNITEDKGLGLCRTCINICHKGHDTIPTPVIAYAFFCDCAVECKCMTFEENVDYSSNFDNNVEPITVYHESLPIELRQSK